MNGPAKELYEALQGCNSKATPNLILDGYWNTDFVHLRLRGYDRVVPDLPALTYLVVATPNLPGLLLGETDRFTLNSIVCRAKERWLELSKTSPIGLAIARNVGVSTI